MGQVYVAIWTVWYKTVARTFIRNIWENHVWWLKCNYKYKECFTFYVKYVFLPSLEIILKLLLKILFINEYSTLLTSFIVKLINYTALNIFFRNQHDFFYTYITYSIFQKIYLFYIYIILFISIFTCILLIN